MRDKSNRGLESLGITLNILIAKLDLALAGPGEGRERAKARGVILGRKPKLTGHQRRGSLGVYEDGLERLLTRAAQ